MCPHHHPAAEEPHCGFPGAADDKPPVLFAAMHGITFSSVENLNVKLRRGENMPKCHYNWKSRIVPFQLHVRLEVELDPTVPMRVVRNDLEAIVERNGGNVEALGTEVVDEVVRLRREPPQSADAGGRYCC